MPSRTDQLIGKDGIVTNDIDPTAVRVPSLVVRGESDIWLDGDVAARLAAGMPNGQLVRLPGVGRLVPEEAPDQLVGLLLDFIEGRLHSETRSMA